MDFSYTVILQLVIAVLLGSAIGVERELKRKPAGIQTYSLVTLGACLFTILSFDVFERFMTQSQVSFDPSRIIMAVATGIGFIGAGVIIYRRAQVEGLTTAAGLWATAAIGVAVGMQNYVVAIAATALAVIILLIVGSLEHRIFKEEK